MGKNPAFPLYASDFDMDTATWENDEIGAYLRLLLYEWVNGYLPNDIYKLSKITRESQKKFIGKWKNLSTKFIPDGNGFLINKRMEEVRQIQLKYSESRRKNISSRYKSKPTYEDTHVEHMDLHNPLSSSSSSSSKNKERIIRKKVSKMPDSEWLQELQKKECYSYLNIISELEKCSTYFEVKGIPIITRQRFLNWINNPKFHSKPLKTKNEEFKIGIEEVVGSWK